jgi:hypothetical protein
MITPFLPLEQMDKVYKVEQDWLFEKLLGKLNSNRHLIIAAAQDWGLQEYLRELGFQLVEKYSDIQICYMDMMPVHSSSSFLELFVATLSHSFPEVVSSLDIDSSSMDILELPTLISQRRKIRIAVFLANSHLFHRIRDPFPFLRMLKLKLKNQKNCIFCFYGNNNPYFRDLVHYPGPLSGLGQLIELGHNLLHHRSASIRKFFHDHDKDIGYNTSVQMSYIVDNHPFYLKLLVWHAFKRTDHTCTLGTIEYALNDLIHHFDHHFYKIIESLTPKQLSFLKAMTEGNQKLYSKATRNEYQLGSTSNIARIKQSLQKREIISSGSKSIFFIDPIFREWLRRCFFRKLVIPY